MIQRPNRVIALLLVLCLPAVAQAQLKVLHHRKSEFNEIFVQESSTGVRYLTFGQYGATQTAMDLSDPDRLLIAYTRGAMSGLAIVPKPQRILIIGLGGGCMPSFLRRNFPEAQIDVAELDPAVFEVARQFFNFREDAKMKVHIGDGRKFVETTEQRYDLIFLDAYGEDYIPYMLATREFLTTVRKRLAEGGVVVANVWSDYSNKLYHSMVRTYQDAFGELHIIAVPGSSNRIFLAAPGKIGLDKEQWVAKARQVKLPRSRMLDLPAMIDEGYLPGEKLPGEARVLVDGDAPKDGK